MNKKIIIILIIFIVILFSLYFINITNKNKNKNEELQIPVLIYHHFLSDDEKEKYEFQKDYSVSVSTFEKQMKYLYDNGYKSITLEQMLCWKNKECEIDPKSFMITIDDGQKSVLHYAYPILEKYKFNAISFVISTRIGKKEEWDPSYYQYLSNDELKNTQTISFGSHSHDMHAMVNNKKKLYSMSYEEIFNDVVNSKKILNATAFAYPFNTYNNNFIKAVKEAGYSLAFRGQSQKTSQSEDKYKISRIFVSEDMNSFKDIFETKKYNRKAGE